MQKFKIQREKLADALPGVEWRDLQYLPDFIELEGELLEGGTVEKCCMFCLKDNDYEVRKCNSCPCHNKKTDSSYLNQERLVNKINETLDFLGDFVTYLKSHEH